MSPVITKMQPVKLDRNNTNFTMQLLEFFKNTKWESKYDFLKYYQNLVREFINDVSIDARGLLVYQTMGLGKSILAIAVAMDLIKERQPIILLTKSLQDNMKKSVHKYVKLRKAGEPTYFLGLLSDTDLDDWIKHNFSFVSMNASNMLKQMSRAAEGHGNEEFDAVLEKKFGDVLRLTTLDGKLLIVDEAHNLFRAITNGSKNAHGLYDMIMKSKNLKILFLTGTPIANDPFELVPCFNMLGSKRGEPTLPEDYKEFNKLYVDEKNGRIKNKEKFQNRILGLVSHVSHSSKPGAAFGITDSSTKAEFPEELPISVMRVHMDGDQFTMYQLARDKENEEGSGGGRGAGPKRAPDVAPMTKPKSKASSTYRVKSRQLSNFCAPEGFREEKDPAKIPVSALGSAKYRKILDNINQRPGQLGITYSQFVGIGGLGSFAKYLEANGWEQYHLPGIVGAGPGLPTADEILEHIATGSWVGDFDEIIGINDGFDAGFDIVGIDAGSNVISIDIDTGIDAGFDLDQCFLGGDDSVVNKSAKNRKYAIISGDVSPADRAAIQDIFNSEENKHGGIIDMILLSSTGAEGLDLKNVRHIHVMEPYWNWGRVMQIIARGVRNDSHIMLDPSEKNVSSFIYLAVPPETSDVLSTTDTELYDESVLNQVTIESFNEALKEVSIECMANAENHCRVCNPTSAALFTADPARDVKVADPCSQLRETQVTAEEIIIDGVKYYFAKNIDSVYGYKVFIYDKDINGYRPMKESNPLFDSIVSAINSRDTSN